MPNRYVRDACLDSDHYHAVGLTGRLAFLELLLNCDDFGLVPVHRVFLQRKTTVFVGLSPEAIGAELLSMDQADLIRCYTVGSSPFAYVPRNGFVIRAKRPKYPLPDFSAPHNRTRFKELAEICYARALHIRPTSTSTSTSTSTGKDMSPSPAQGPESQQPAVLELALAEPPTAALADCPADAILQLFQRVIPESPRTVILNERRRGALRLRWKELAKIRGYTTRAQGLAEWERLFEFCRESAFLMGKTKPSNGHRPFELSIDFLLQPARFIDTLEGKYHGS
jgi:hypothetical protein